MTNLGKTLQNKGKAHSCVGCGDQGHMYAIGSHIVHDKEAHNSTCVPYAGSSAAGSTLPPAVQAMEKSGLSLFPSLLRSTQSALLKECMVFIPIPSDVSACNASPVAPFDDDNDFCWESTPSYPALNCHVFSPGCGLTKSEWAKFIEVDPPDSPDVSVNA